MTMKRLFYPLVVLVGLPGPTPAYIDAPPTLGRLVQFDATEIAVVRVEKVSREKGVIVYKNVSELKGKYPAKQIRQHVSRRITDAPGPEDNPRPRGAHSILDWAEKGKEAIFFHDGNRKACAICVGEAWYFGWPGEDGWWAVNEFEERGLAWAYVGPVEKLREHVAAILADKEVVVTAARYDRGGGGSRELWDNQTAYRNLARDTKVRVWRIHASRSIVSLTDALAGRDFVVGVGTGDREAVPALVKRLKDREPSARARAAEDLGQVGPEGRDAVPSLTEALKDPDGRVRVSAAEALTEVGGEASVAAHALAGALAEKDVQVRRDAAVALWRMGPEAKAAVPALAKALKDEDRDVRRDVAATLWRVGHGAAAAVPSLCNALKDDDREVRCSAAGALGAIGSEAKAAVPALTEALGDKDPDTRQFAARALVRIGDLKARSAAAPVLREELRRVPDQRVRTELIVFLWTIGPEPASTFPTLKDGDAGDIISALQLWPKADKGTRENAVPTLVAALRGAKASAPRAQLAQVLGEIGPAAAEAIPVLVEATKDGDDSLRKQATEALKKIQKK
jgi:HEAT repeat protein